MPEQLFRLAENEGIRIDYWDLGRNVEAIYHAEPGMQPVICFSTKLKKCSTAHFRTVFAEELGHHFTTVGYTLSRTYTSYRDRLMICKSEELALRWAANYLMPDEQLERAMLDTGVIGEWELAELFRVDESLVKFRFGLLSEIWKGKVQEELVRTGVIDEDYYWEY